ncbi:MAG: ATP-binding cassette domain-containing protein [Verrucomicrobia bacterium]|nr:ATP-binding cassette domain-containing protein [Verrucomicrobiota bacterium]
MALISCDSLTLHLGGRTLLDAANLQVERGERIGLLGRNGEGKSTLLSLLANQLTPDQGTISVASGTKVALLTQHPPKDLEGTVEDLIASGDSGNHHSDHPVQRLCSLLQLDPEQSVSTLSGGQARRALLGRALICEPDVLLLDEPTNHLDIDSIVWLENFLTRYPGSLLFVTHDRAFLQKLATRIIELDRGHLTSWACDYPTYLERKEELLLAEEKQWAVFDKKLAQEEVWIRQGIKARRTRNEGRVRALEALRAERSRRRERVGQVEMTLQQAERTGVKVITAKQLGFAFNPDTPIVRDLSLTLTRGDKVGIIGPNGCGKTTLIRLLLGQLNPDTGSVEHGTKLQVAYFDQHRDQLDPDRTVFENIADGNDFITVDGQRRHVISYLGDFLFPPDAAPQPVSHLSGGERNRLLLARLFTRPSNVLVLDEPTNDLDADTLELLEARLVDYPGTVIAVSHDRRFLDNLCTSSLVFEGDGQVRDYAGGYTEWQRTRARQSTPTATAPVPARTPTPPPPKARKLTNREREEWTRLPADIEALENELETIQQRLADPDFFRGDPDAIRTTTERAQQLPGLIEQHYARWSELEERA